MLSKFSENSTKKEKRRSYYRKNKDRIYESHKTYIRNHSEARKEYLRKYWANPINQQKRRDWYKKNLEKVRAKDKAHYHKTKERHSEVYRCRKYGISLDEYRSLISRGKCDICGQPETATNKVLCIDHCHETQKVRGLLCGNCNKGIGSLRDSIELLEKATVYLKNHAQSS